MTVFAVAKTGSELQLDVFDVIGEDFFGEGVSAKAVSRALADAGKFDSIKLRINSPGGSVFEGMTIYNLLREHRAKITVSIVGLAASMASILALVGNRVEMSEGSMLMIHNPWAFSIGDQHEMAKAAEMLDKIKGSMLNIYEARSHLSRDEISAIMDAETWLTPAEAVKHGFADAVVADEKKAQSSTEAKARFYAMLLNFEHAPDALHGQYACNAGMKLAMAAAKGQPISKPAASNEKRDERNTTMERDKIIAALGLPADATDDQIFAALAKPKASEPSLRDFVPRADFEAAQRQLAEVQARQEAETRARFEADVNAVVGAAVASGKITPGTKDYYIKSLSKGGPEALHDFQELFIAAAAPIIPAGSQIRERPPEALLPGDVAAVTKQLGITAQDLAKSQAEMAQDPETYNPRAYGLAL